MALKSDITQSSDNRTLDLHERRVINPQMDLAGDVLDLRNPEPERHNQTNDFFFEFLPTASMATPTLPLEDIKEVAAKAYGRAKTFAAEHPRYLIVAVLVLAAIALFSLSATTHRRIIKARPETPVTTTSTTTDTNSAPADISTQASPPTASTPASAASSNQAAAPNQPAASAATSPNSTPPQQNSGSVDPTVCTPAAAVLPSACSSIAVPVPQL